MSQDTNYSDLVDSSPNSPPPFDQYQTPLTPPSSPIPVRDDEWVAFKDACTAVNISGRQYIRYTPPGVNPLNLVYDREAERKQYCDKLKAEGY